MERIELPDPPLTDGNVTLRGWREGDVQDLFEACQDPAIPRWTIRIPDPYLIGHARDWVARQPDLQRSGDGAHFAITDAGSGALLGGIGLELTEPTAEIGYWLAAPARGRGVCTRATRLVARWGLSELGLTRIHLRTHDDNIASQAVAERAGFVQEGRIEGEDRQGTRRSFLLYVLPAGPS